ncbi:MAG: hypothetical protein AAGI06_10380, partial [Pseudomonadota bacterium]
FATCRLDLNVIIAAPITIMMARATVKISRRSGEMRTGSDQVASELLAGLALIRRRAALAHAPLCHRSAQIALIDPPDIVDRPFLVCIVVPVGWSRNCCPPGSISPLTPDTYPEAPMARVGNESPEHAALPVYNKDLLIW